ncbi:MAG TPA: hypothetical protein VLI39_18790, partial [Sedimentisphaerales bacterium]|nr:hypothetical protein [Sedimentisphaerales bacterium]
MANQLKMAVVQAILTLVRLGWSPVKGGAKVRRVAGRSKSAALPEAFCENGWSLTALEAVLITRVSAER